MRIFIFLLLFLAVAGSALACSPMWFDRVEHGENALIAKVGYVVGERYPSYERRVLAGEDPRSQEAWQERLLRVAVIDNLRGDDAKFVEVPTACGAPFPELFERVTVVQGRDGYLRVFPAQRTEQKLRQAISGETATAIDSGENGEPGGFGEAISIRLRPPHPRPQDLLLMTYNAIDALKQLPGVHAVVRSKPDDPWPWLQVFRMNGYGVDGFEEALKKVGLDYYLTHAESEAK
jgi:hypothetical protein